MSYSRPASGFTLIELLVVIAILGILTSVVLGSLQTARSRAQDAAVRTNMAAARPQGELFHAANGHSYEGVCDSGAPVGGVEPVYRAVSAAVFATGGSTVGNGPTTATDGTCNDDANAWAAEAALRSGDFYCIDNIGNATTSETSLLDAGEMVCE